VGSSFALQLLGNVCVTGSAIYICQSSLLLGTLLYFVNIVIATGVSVIGTNIMCHRYLLARARVMVMM
jgi:hypothetical protein